MKKMQNQIIESFFEVDCSEYSDVIYCVWHFEPNIANTWNRVKIIQTCFVIIAVTHSIAIFIVYIKSSFGLNGCPIVEITV